MTKVVYHGLSGGVDSAVSAALLSQQSGDVACIYMNCFMEQMECSSDTDVKDALRVASALGCNFNIWDLRSEYAELVLKRFYREYELGVTPNPDILCNSEIKFGAFVDKVDAIDPSAKISTGHYVRNLVPETVGDLDPNFAKKLETSGLLGKNFLFTGVDTSKDQSYFLYGLYKQEDLLPRLVFPIGGLLKSDVRKIAKSKLGFVANKPDSQGICFVGNVKLRKFLKGHVQTSAGDVVDESGQVIGSHSGVQLYTIGQRHGFDIDKYFSEPSYVLDKDVKNNRLIVGPRAGAYCSSFEVTELIFPYNLLNTLPDFNELGLSVRIRHLGKKIPATVLLSGLDDSKLLNVRLSNPEFGVAPGQSAVFYLGELMLGGGVIKTTHRQ